MSCNLVNDPGTLTRRPRQGLSITSISRHLRNRTISSSSNLTGGTIRFSRPGSVGITDPCAIRRARQPRIDRSCSMRSARRLGEARLSFSLPLFRLLCVSCSPWKSSSQFYFLPPTLSRSSPAWFLRCLRFFAHSLSFRLSFSRKLFLLLPSSPTCIYLSPAFSVNAPSFSLSLSHFLASFTHLTPSLHLTWLGIA